MKILNTDQFISERIKVQPITNAQLNTVQKYRYFPKTKEELKQLIKERIESEGPECDLNDIYTTNITDMSKLFLCSKFNGDISKWDVSNVTNMSEMFEHANFNKPIDMWDVSNVKDMSYMFACDHEFNQPLNAWKDKLSNVTTMYSMFDHASSFDQDLND